MTGQVLYFNRIGNQTDIVYILNRVIDLYTTRTYMHAYKCVFHMKAH